MKDVLAFDQAGPVAILVLVLTLMLWFTRWLLVKLIASKDAQIAKLSQTVDDLIDEVGETLDTILSAVQQQAEERRRGR